MREVILLNPMNKIVLSDSRDFLMWRQGSGETIEIFDIAVGSERRKGRGRQLLNLLFNSLEANTVVWAITRSDNEIAQQFYEATRFDIIGVLRRFYGVENGVDAIMYGRKAKGVL